VDFYHKTINKHKVSLKRQHGDGTDEITTGQYQ